MKLATVNGWHKILGMIATFFIIILSITGYLLLHTDVLRLQDRNIESDWLLDWYGIAPSGTPVSFSAGGTWVTQLDQQVYLGGQLLTATPETIRGVVSVQGFYIIAFDNSLLLATNTGEIVELIRGVQGLPRDINRIGTGTGSLIAIRNPEGIYTSNLNLSEWQPSGEEGINWSRSQVSPEKHLEQIMQAYRGSGLSLERVVLDLHSGRILGSAGILLIDISVLVFLALAFTGWWSWFKRRAIQKEIDEEL